MIINKTHGGHILKITLGIAMLILLLASGANPAFAVDSSGVWIQVPHMVSPHIVAYTVLLDTGKVLEATGQGAVSGLISTSELFDPVSQTWTATEDVNQPRMSWINAMVKLNDGRAMMAGGEGPGVSDLSSVELYDPASGTWSYTSSLHTARRHPAVIKLLNGKVLVTAGANGPPDGNRFLASTEIYDPATGQWTYSGNLNVAREPGNFVLLHDGRAMIAGGEGPWRVMSNTAEIYDPNTGQWTLTPPMLYGWGGASMTVLNDGRVLVAGGGTRQAMIYDPTANTWTYTGSMNSPRATRIAALLSDGKVLVAGGSDGSAQLKSSEIYDPETGQWTIVGDMHQEHNVPGVATLPNGDILVAGGDAIGTAELFTHITPTPEPTFNISGFKINNANGSGVQGWNITLMNSTMQESMLTGVDGSYMFTNLVNDTYNVTEETKTGWMNMSPMSQQVTINGADMPNTNFTNAPAPVPTPPTPIPASITVVSPNGGENWQPGSTQTIKWSYTGNPGDKVNIELLKPGKANQIIVSGYSIGSGGIGTYNWKIPSTQVSGTDYKVRITSTTNSAYTDTSDGDFSVSVQKADTDVAILTIFSVGGGNISSGSGYLGHSWITVKNIGNKPINVGKFSGVEPGKTISMGTWGNQPEHKGLWYNLESFGMNKGIFDFTGRVSISYSLDSKKLDKLNKLYLFSYR